MERNLIFKEIEKLRKVIDPSKFDLFKREVMSILEKSQGDFDLRVILDLASQFKTKEKFLKKIVKKFLN